MGVSACSHHLRLVAPATSPGARYHCGAGSDCTPAQTQDPAQSAKQGTVMVTLPPNCQGRFNEILIRNADSKTPDVTVTCAPPEPEVGTMGPSTPETESP